ncbi:TetR/AcrR family transcriptional regulator [Bosea sp. ASV33]|uniref:TetR/AcrR family transcriptional regulator n=1 Tax=Bosea sp. ASV33 TaxID=2795106 RepID=UPI0018EC596B|nr:TetR/AcrR family transcriptional regulator [Bosea sp. ASV33]
MSRLSRSPSPSNSPAAPKPGRTGKGGRPSKARESAISDEILDLACEMFASQGYAATSVERLAIACRVGKDTIYRRFPSKRALFDAAVERLRVRVLKRLECVTADGGPAIDRLRHTARWFLAVNVEPELVALRRIACSEVVLPNDAPAPVQPDPIMERLVDVVRQAQAAGAIADVEPGFLAAQLIHAVASGPSNEAMVGRQTYVTAAAQDAYFEKAWSLFLKGAAS